MRKAMRLVALSLLATMVTACWPAGAAIAAANTPATRAVMLVTALRVENTGRDISSVRLAVPLPANDPSPYRTIAEERLGVHLRGVEGTDAERTGNFAFRLKPGETVILELRHLMTVSAYQPPLHPATLVQAEEDHYLMAEPGIEADDHALRVLALRLTGTATSPAEKAERIFAFVRGHVRYDPASPAANRGALAGYRAGSGGCTELAGLFVALARAAGVPSRTVNGEILLDARGKPAAGPFEKVARHQWAEFFDPARGWVPVDPAFAARVEASLSVPAYVRENVKDRPVTGRYQGGRIVASLAFDVEPAVMEGEPAAVPAAVRP